MSTISEASNKNGFKSHVVPSIVTAALALSAAIPLTAALASQSRPVSADVVPVSVSKTADTTCNAPDSATTTSSASHNTGAVLGAETANYVHHVPTSSTTTTSNGSGNGNGNSGQGNGNGNGSGSNANGNTQTAIGGLIGGVNAIVPVSALNGTLNGVLSGNSVSVPVLSNNNGNTTSVPVLNNVLNTVTGIL